MQNKKEIAFGFIVGVAAALIGLVVATLVLGSDSNIIKSLQIAKTRGVLTMLISVGSIANLLVFFYFLSRRRDAAAKGVLFATLVIALFIFVFKYL